MTTPIRAVTYSRYSSDRQRATSIEDQQRICRERAHIEGWCIVADYVDAAITGTDATRPAYREMQAAAKNREFDVLMVDDLSRLSRDSVDQEQVIRRLEFQGVRVVAPSDGYDSVNEARKVVRQMKGIQNSLFLDDLAKKIHRGQKGQALKARWNGGRPFGYKLKPILDTAQQDAYGQPARIGTVLEVEPQQASIVREIFTRFSEGASCGAIARELNTRGVASPGSTWRRKTRRCKGWVESSVRVILQNELYVGKQHWNTCRFVQNPDTGKYLRRARPVAEHVVNNVAALRIVSDELFQDACARLTGAKTNSPKLKLGGKPKYVLSGLLRCALCGANYQMGDAHKYACDSYLHGGTALCSNSERVRRDRIEELILGPIRRDLLAPARVAKMAREIEDEYQRRLREATARASEVPAELAALDGRLDRLRARLQAGDPDMTTDELQAAIDRAEAKRKELHEAQPDQKQTARILSMLPRAADAYRKQIEAGLDGNPDAASKARVFLRDLLGPIDLSPGPSKGELWASYRVSPAMLVKSIAGTSGRGDRI